MILDVTISPAAPDDTETIAALLRGDGLPPEGFASHLGHFLVARDPRGKVIGTIGAEIYGAEALLRSFVVSSDHRRAGIGGKLLDELERAAGDWGVARWWLLTTTAEGFFEARGFRVIPRAAAPACIRGTDEFRGLCPSVAACLSRERHVA